MGGPYLVVHDAVRLLAVLLQHGDSYVAVVTAHDPRLVYRIRQLAPALWVVRTWSCTMLCGCLLSCCSTAIASNWQ